MGKRKSRRGDRDNVVAFRSKAERETQQAEVQRALSASCAQVIEFPIDRVKARGPIFNLSYRETSDGQRSLDFDGLDRSRAPCEVVQLRPEPVQCMREAYNLYIRASQLDEDPATYDEAVSSLREGAMA